jgi:cytochrome c-type biogenesis protein CcmH/NrfF
MMSVTKKRRFAALILVATLAMFTLGADSARQRFEKVGHELMCTCGCNQVLLECNHVGCPSSDGMRNELMAGLKSGTDASTRQSFVDKYGPTVLAAPTMVGFDRVAWITPFAVFILGMGLAIFVVRNWKLRPASMPVAKPGSVSNPETMKSFRDRARQETEI